MCHSQPQLVKFVCLASVSALTCEGKLESTPAILGASEHALEEGGDMCESPADRCLLPVVYH